MTTGSDGVSLRLPQLFLSQHRLCLHTTTNTHTTTNHNNFWSARV